MGVLLLKETDFLILHHLRQNARENLTDISRKTKIPVSTLFDRLKLLERGPICKYASLLDFKKLGFTVRPSLLLRCDPTQREALKKYLFYHEHVNTLIRVNNGYEYLAECIFRDMESYQRFLDHLLPFHIDVKEHFVLEEIKRETFLSEGLNLPMLLK